MHNIQHSILTNLMTHDTLRFSELRPKNVDSNLFQYHLQTLIKEGYISKADHGYCLSGHGLNFADRYSGELKEARVQPKIIAIVILRNSAGKVLLFEKPRQPWLGSYHLPAGKVHETEPILEAGKRELLEKTGISAATLDYVAQVHVTIRQNEALVSEYYGSVLTGISDDEPDSGNWYDPSDLPELCPSVAEILSTLQDNKPFYEWTITVPSEPTKLPTTSD